MCRRKYELGRVIGARRDLVEWCDGVGFAYPNSYVSHKEKGTWFHMRFTRWHDMDWFLDRRD